MLVVSAECHREDPGTVTGQSASQVGMLAEQKERRSSSTSGRLKSYHALDIDVLRWG